MTFTSSPTYSGTEETPVSQDSNNTDLVHQEVSLFIEGVEVPFESMSISQVYRDLPTATIQIPVVSGLLDIIRGYSPKVHIFYKDKNYGGDRLLFWGHIKATSYSKNRASGSSSISLACEHKNALLRNVSLEFSGWASSASESFTDSSPSASTKVGAFNSLEMVVNAMSGVGGVASSSEAISISNTSLLEAPTDKVPAILSKLEDRFSGMPGIALNMWNQIKKYCLQNPTASLGMLEMWAPLLEEGIAFFKRTSGHFILEEKLQASKAPYCHGRSPTETKTLTPPCFGNQIASAVQNVLGVRSVANAVQFSGELTSFIDLLNTIYETCQYELQTLASPAEIAVSPTEFIADVNKEGVEKVTVETVIKPRLPFYYSPICNVILPRMYFDIQIQQDESRVPTRVVALHEVQPDQASQVNTYFKGPASIRESVALNHRMVSAASVKVTAAGISVADSLATNWSLPGKYEQGKGIQTEKIVLPWWLAVLSNEKEVAGKVGQEQAPRKGSSEYDSLVAIAKEWYDRNLSSVVEVNGVAQVNQEYFDKKDLNPLDPSNTTIKPNQRLLVSAMDVEFSERVASARSGTINGIFNPYVVPGYPMDVIDDSINHPSFHGFCTSVTHTITSRSISTTIGMSSVQTYAELSNFYCPPAAPALQSALNMVDFEVDAATRDAAAAGDLAPYKNTNATLLQNKRAKQTADDFYKQVLGVGAAAPDDLIHFSTNRAIPLKRYNGGIISEVIPSAESLPKERTEPSSSGREGHDFYSSVGNLRLVSRPIEGKNSISKKFGYSFIPRTKEYYNQTQVRYVNPLAAASLFLEPGSSLFLEYQRIEDFAVERFPT